MYSKGQLFYADWRGEDGKRKRKSFDTALAARRYENKMKRQANPTTAQASRKRSGRTAKPSAPPTPTVPQQRPTSSPIAAGQPSQTFVRAISSKYKRDGTEKPPTHAGATPSNSESCSVGCNNSAHRPSTGASGSEPTRKPARRSQPPKSYT